MKDTSSTGLKKKLVYIQGKNAFRQTGHIVYNCMLDKNYLEIMLIYIHVCEMV